MSARPSAGAVVGALALTALLCAGAFFAYGRYRAAGADIEARRAAVAKAREDNVALAKGAALVKNTRFRVKADNPGELLGIGAVYLDEAGKPQVFQTSACGDWPGERYGGGNLDLSVSTRDCSWGGQVAFYVLQFQSTHPQYPRPITLVGSWGNPTHVSENVVRLP